MDLEKALVAVLAPAFPTARLCTELPAVLPELTIQVTQLPGRRPLVGYEETRVDLDTYAPTRETARLLADAVDAFLTQLPGQKTGGLLILSVATSSAVCIPYDDNPNVRRMTATAVIRSQYLA